MTTKTNDHNQKAHLASQFNQFYLQITSPNVSQIGNYKIIDEIGEGAFGKVYLAVHILLNVKVVLKCGLVDDPNIVREIYYHRQLKHKNIVNLYEVIKTENHLWIVLEYCEGSELFFYIYEKKRLDIQECQELFFQIVLALKYVHSLNLSHRDLKLENILLADRKKTIVKLTDFGFVREYNPHNRKLLSTICGTAVYMAPELLKNEKYSGFEIDIWSLGVILFTMLYGEMPFDEDDDMVTKFKIVNDEPIYKDTISQDYIDLVRKMLSKEPSRRPDLNEILNSSFLVDLNNSHLEKTNHHSNNDTESILSINQHYHVTNSPFQTKIEKVLLRRLMKLDINIEELQNNVYNNEMNSLTAFYELLLTKEFFKKKKRHLREKNKKYQEAKKSLLKSRNRVKSALSLTDVSSTAAQPLEKIKSTLSINSHRTSSKPNLYKLGPDSRRSTEMEYKRIDSQLSRNSYYGRYEGKPESPGSPGSHDKTGSPSFRDSLGKDLIRDGSFNGSLNLRDSFSGSAVGVSGVSGPGVSGVSGLGVSGPNGGLNGSATITNGSVLNGSLPNGIVGRDSSNGTGNGSFNRGDSINRIVSFYPERRDSVSTSSATYSSDTVKKKSRNSHLLNKLKFWKKNKSDYDIEELFSNLSVRENSNLKVSTEHSTSVTLLENEVELGPLETKLPVKEISLDTTPTNNINKPLAESQSPNVIDPIRSTRPRPTSMVSQLSQISHLSQMSTMISESELDILDGSDTEDYDDDDMYESSINASQDFSKLVPVTPTSKPSSKKRPGYKRAMSSDLSSQTSSIANKAKRLSLQSTSSEESSLNFFNEPSRPDSPDLLKNKKRFKHPIFTNANHTNNDYNQSSSFSGVDHPVRAPSPPVSKKLNKMNQRLMKPVRTVFEQRDKGLASSILPKGKIKRHNISNPISVTPKPPNWKMDWNSAANTSGGNVASSQKGYAPVIDEEEEEST